MYAPLDIDEVMAGCGVAPSSAIRSFQFAVFPLFPDVVFDDASLGFLAQVLQVLCWCSPALSRALFRAFLGSLWRLVAPLKSASANLL